MSALRLELDGISKQYPAVRANDRVSLRVKPGEIHAVLGENGAGKSTLMKIIYGAVQPDEGTLKWNGQPVQVRSPAAARELGISMVYQHFSLFDTLTVAENVWLAATGCSILYISHKLDEIRALCHHCTVLRGGKVTGEVDPAQQDNASLSRLMIGVEPPPLRHEQRSAGDVVLAVQGLSLTRQDPFGVDLKSIDFEVHAGEIVGIAGVSGNGQQELMATLSGEDPRAPPGSVRLMGRDIAAHSPRRRRHQGLHFVPEERLGRGAVPTLSLAHNTLLTRTSTVGRSGWISTNDVRRLAEHIINRFQVKAGGSGAAARSLSGGNLQKFIVGREIDANPRLLIVSQPTWGVDVGTAAQIRGELLALRDKGCALLVVSEELDELFEISDRLIVIAQGRMSPSVPIAEARVERIGEWMSGLFDREALHAQA